MNTFLYSLRELDFCPFLLDSWRTGKEESFKFHKMSTSIDLAYAKVDTSSIKASYSRRSAGIASACCIADLFGMPSKGFKSVEQRVSGGGNCPV